MPGTTIKDTFKEIWSFDEDEKEFLLDQSKFTTELKLNS